MGALFASGRIVDLILALVAGEALLLAWLRPRAGAGPALPALAATLASGAALMLAMRAALTGAGWPLVAVWLIAGLAAHLADLRLRFRPGAGPAAADARSVRGCAPGRERADAVRPGAAVRGPGGRIAAASPSQEPASEQPRSRAV